MSIIEPLNIKKIFVQLAVLLCRASERVDVVDGSEERTARRRDARPSLRRARRLRAWSE